MAKYLTIVYMMVMVLTWVLGFDIRLDVVLGFMYVIYLLASMYEYVTNKRRW